ncbi:MAG: hypothetical protein EP319_00915 [Deltaproteobacteria bacterium]|nr:MAG: hypothetical protein EP319_00915 [Deltaproteobacteria bacterium]
MNLKMILVSLFALVLILIGQTQSAQAMREMPSLPHSLTDDEWKIVNSGQYVVKKKKMKDSAWPELTIYTTIDATPQECMAIYAAFDHQKNYVPNLLKSDVIKVVDATTIHTAYEMDLPWPLSTSKYIHGTHLDPENNGIYSLSWFLVESDVSERVQGKSYFFPPKNPLIPQAQKTLWVYQSFIDPKSLLAGIFKNTMVSDVTASLDAIKKEIIRARDQDPKLMQKYIKILEDSLKNIPSYMTR